MEFFDVVRARHSTRTFCPQPIEPEKLLAILDAANRAPSAGNVQSYEIYKAETAKSLQDLMRSTRGQMCITQASVALVFCANQVRSSERFNERGQVLYCIQDATIACAYAQLAATAVGLSSVWVGSFNEDLVRRAVGAGPHLYPVAILPIGYAGEEPRQTPRRLLTDLVHAIS